MTCMSNDAKRSLISTLIGRTVSAAYVYNDGLDAHGVVLAFEDGSEASIEFDSKRYTTSEGLHYRWKEGEAMMIDS